MKQKKKFFKCHVAMEKKVPKQFWVYRAQFFENAKKDR